MLRDERIKKIYAMLLKEGYVEINNLCSIFEVTDMTIRRDLDSLSSEYAIERTHGGAMLVTNRGEEPSYEHRIVSQSVLKEKIAKKALSLIRNSQTLFIDSGTTTQYIAKGITNENRNTIVTNGINIANEIINLDTVSAILIGGDLKKNTHSTRGALAETQVRQFRFDIAFLGANAIGADGSLYVGSTSETSFKRIVMNASSKTYVLVDSSKFNSYNLLSYANANEVTAVITDSNIDEGTKKLLEEYGINIIIAD